MKNYAWYLDNAKRGMVALCDVPYPMRTHEMNLAAIKQGWWQIKFIPIELQTLEECMAYVAQAHFPMTHVPECHKKAIHAYLKLIGKL